MFGFASLYFIWILLKDKEKIRKFQRSSSKKLINKHITHRPSSGPDAARKDAARNLGCRVRCSKWFSEKHRINVGYKQVKSVGSKVLTCDKWSVVWKLDANSSICRLLRETRSKCGWQSLHNLKEALNHWRV